MIEKLEKVKEEGLTKINNANSEEEIETVRKELTGKKSSLTEV